MPWVTLKYDWALDQLPGVDDMNNIESDVAYLYDLMGRMSKPADVAVQNYSGKKYISMTTKIQGVTSTGASPVVVHSILTSFTPRDGAIITIRNANPASPTLSWWSLTKSSIPTGAKKLRLWNHVNTQVNTTLFGLEYGQIGRFMFFDDVWTWLGRCHDYFSP